MGSPKRMSGLLKGHWESFTGTWYLLPGYGGTSSQNVVYYQDMPNPNTMWSLLIGHRNGFKVTQGLLVRHGWILKNIGGRGGGSSRKSRGVRMRGTSLQHLHKYLQQTWYSHVMHQTLLPFLFYLLLWPQRRQISAVFSHCSNEGRLLYVKRWTKSQTTGHNVALKKQIISSARRVQRKYESQGGIE